MKSSAFVKLSKLIAHRDHGCLTLWAQCHVSDLVQHAACVLPVASATVGAQDILSAPRTPSFPSCNSFKS